MNDIGDAVTALLAGMLVLIAVSVPLAVWKLVEIGIWMAHHVHIGVH